MLKGAITLTINVASSDIDQSKSETPFLYPKVFVSYARDDSEIIDDIITKNTTGARFCSDKEIKSGQKWEDEIREMINNSDIFQLFWSRRSMRSKEVKKEWEHALSLKREGFIMPVYWENPRPKDDRNNLPPPELEALHFQYIPMRPRRRWRFFSILAVLALFTPKLTKAATAALVALITSLSITGGVGLWYQLHDSRPSPRKEAVNTDSKTSREENAQNQASNDNSSTANPKQPPPRRGPGLRKVTSWASRKSTA